MTTTQKWNGFGARPSPQPNRIGRQLVDHAPQIFAAAMAKGLISGPSRTEPSREVKHCLRCDRPSASEICLDCLAQIQRKGVGDSGRVLVRLVCAAFSVGETDVLGQSRLAHIVEARQVLVWCLRELCGWGWSQIGRFIDRNHGTVLHAHRQVVDRIELDASLKLRVQLVTKEFSRGTKPEAAAACVDGPHLVGAGCRHPQH